MLPRTTTSWAATTSPSSSCPGRCCCLTRPGPLACQVPPPGTPSSSLPVADPLLTQGLAEVGAEATVVGFGVTNTTTHVKESLRLTTYSLQASADILQRAMIHVVAPDRCQMPDGASALASSFRWQIGGDQICAKGEDVLGDSPCFRDSCQVSLWSLSGEFLFVRETPEGPSYLPTTAGGNRGEQMEDLGLFKN